MTASETQVTGVRVTNDGLDLGEETRPIISGEIHYFQHEPRHWPRLLDSAVRLGLNTVSTYVPWGVHEPKRGRVDFGERRRALDVKRFVELAGERELLVVARPGPHINGELNWLGYPRWLLEKREIQARTPRGNPLWLPIAPRPIPIPSYAASAFLEATDEWLSVVASQLDELQWPKGPLVMVQLDNEAPLVFRNGPFDQDYHPDAVAIFQELRASRGRIDVDPPRELDSNDPEALRTVMDWIESRHIVFSRALERMRATLTSNGLSQVVYTHNVAQGGIVPEVSPNQLAAVDLVGFDFYHERHKLGLMLDRSAYVVGTNAYPFAAELGIGGPWNLPARSPQTSMDHLRAALAAGFRGFNLFMVADRDRYYGAPIASDGPYNEGSLARDIERLVRAFKRTHLHRLRRHAPVVVIVPRKYANLTQATWTLGPYTPPALQVFGLDADLGVSEESFGFDEPIQLLWEKKLELLLTALRGESIGYAIVDSDGLESRLDELEPEVAILLTYQLAEPDTLEALISRVEKGLSVIVAPRIPSLDEDRRELELEALTDLDKERSRAVGQGNISFNTLADEAEARELARELGQQDGIRPHATTDAGGVELTVLVDGKEPRVVCIADRGGHPERVAIQLEKPATLRDLESKRSVDAARVELAHSGVRLLEIVEAGQ